MKKASPSLTALVFSFSIFTSYFSYGQKEARWYEQAETSLQEHRYDEARKLYLEVSNENAEYEDIEYRLALTNLLTGSGDDDPVSSFTAFETPFAKEDDHYYYWLGQIYLRRYRQTEALEAFEKFEQVAQYTGSVKDEKTKELITYSKQIQYYFDHPDNYEIHKLPAPINSKSAELSPVYFQDENELLFASDRNKSGEKPFAIYLSTKNGSEWSTPTEVTSLGNFTRTNANVEVVNEDGKLFLFREENGGDLFYSQPSGPTWSAPSEFDSKVSNNNLASHFFINEHEDRIIFSYDQGENGLDIYESFRDPKNGKWSKPAPFYTAINSPYNEDSPYLSPDENTLYFCSDRPGGLGGFDVYVSHFTPTNYSWSTPENMGWPINSPNEEFHFKMNSNQSSGYFVSNRLHTTGDYDIYFFWHIEKVQIEGRIFDSSIAGPLTNAEIRFHPSQYGDEYFGAKIDDSGRYSTKIIADEVFDVEIIKNGKVILKEQLEINETTGSPPTTHIKDFTVH